LGILLKAKKSGFITKLKPLLYALKEKGIWLDQKLIHKILKLADENY
jgi:predicted nucleic acid-binding protein